MRYLVISDIHANLEALDVCLADALTHGYDRTVVLGDIVERFEVGVDIADDEIAHCSREAGG